MHPPALPEKPGSLLVPNGVLAARRSIDSGYQSMVTQERGEFCFNNPDQAWVEQGIYEAIGASWGPMTPVDVQVNYPGWSI